MATMMDAARAQWDAMWDEAQRRTTARNLDRRMRSMSGPRREVVIVKVRAADGSRLVRRVK